MSHDITSAAYSNNPAWHGLGIVVPRGMFLDEAMRLAGLDWTVEKRELLWRDSFDSPRTIHDKRAIVRSDTRAYLGVVGATYEPFQNHQLADLARALMENDPSAYVESALELSGGKDIVLLVKLREWKLRDTADMSVCYLCLANNHTGDASLRVFDSEIRVQCRNTLTRAENGSARNKIGFRHTSGIHAATQELVKQAEQARAASERWEDDAHRMAHWTLEGSDAARLSVAISEAIMGPIRKAEADDPHGKIASARARLIESIQDAGRHGSPDFRGSAWDLFNRATGYIDHDSRIRVPEGSSRHGQRQRNRILPESLGNQRKRAIRKAFEEAMA